MAAHITRRHVMRVVLSAVVVLFLSQEVAARRRLLQDGDACVTADFPLAFRHPVTFNVNEGLGVFKDDSTNLECHCEDHHCDCTGETDEDCDEYSQIWFNAVAWAHQLGAFAYDLPEYDEQYHLHSMAVWGIIGLVLGWLGIIAILYVEIKAVSITRERDERSKLVAIRAMERTKKMIELEEREALAMAPRPYVTICGAVLLFIGLFCQLIPFCHLLSELGLPVAFHGFCPLFVLTSALMLAACGLLLILGVVWSCTRGWAALLLLSLGLLGDLLLFGGFVACLIWMVVSLAALYLYFVYLPSQYNVAEGDKKASWLQDLGSFEVEADVGRVRAAFEKGGKVLVNDLVSNPVSEAVSGSATSIKQQLDKLGGSAAETEKPQRL